jgi:hypothetical protein
MSDMASLKKDAIAILILTAVTLTSLAIAVGYKTSNVLDSTGNDTADKFVTGLTIFGTFAGILALVAIGRVVFKMFGK